MAEDIEKLLAYGRMGLETGRYEQAREDFEKVLALDPSNREAMKGLARVNEILSRREAIAAPRIGARPEVPSEAPVKPPPEPVATSKTRSISIGLARLTLGRKVSVSGALLALFCFFLPWIELSCSGMMVTSVSGIDIATNSSQTDSAGWTLFLVPLAALSVLVSVYLALGIPTLRANISATFESLEALVGLIFTSRVYFVIQDAMQDALQDARTGSNLTFLDLPIPDPEFFLRFVYGYWGTLAGFVAVIVGALLDRKESQSKPRDKTMHVLAGRDRTVYVLAGIVLSVVVLTVVWAMTVGTTPKGPENWSWWAATPTPKPKETPAIGMSRVNPVPVGRPVIADNNIQLTVLGLERNAWPRIHQMYSFNPEPEEGMEYVIVTLRVANLGDPAESQTINEWDFQAVGERGTVYYPCFFSYLENELSAQLFGGGTTDGQLCFEVGQGEKELVLIYNPGWGTTPRYLSLSAVLSTPAAPLLQKDLDMPLNRGGVVIHLKAIGFDLMEELPADLQEDFSRLGEWTEYWKDASIVGGIDLEVTNTTDEKISVYPNQGTVVAGDEQVGMDTWTSGDVGRYLSAGAMKESWVLFGLKRTDMTTLDSIRYIVSAPFETDSLRRLADEDYVFVIPLR